MLACSRLKVTCAGPKPHCLGSHAGNNYVILVFLSVLSFSTKMMGPWDPTCVSPIAIREPIGWSAWRLRWLHPLPWVLTGSCPRSSSGQPADNTLARALTVSLAHSFSLLPLGPAVCKSPCMSPSRGSFFGILRSPLFHYRAIVNRRYKGRVPGFHQS